MREPFPAMLTRYGKFMLIEVEPTFPSAHPMFFRNLGVNSTTWYISILYEIDILIE